MFLQMYGHLLVLRHHQVKRWLSYFFNFFSDTESPVSGQITSLEMAAEMSPELEFGRWGGYCWFDTHMYNLRVRAPSRYKDRVFWYMYMDSNYNDKTIIMPSYLCNYHLLICIRCKQQEPTVFPMSEVRAKLSYNAIITSLLRQNDLSI